MSDNYPAPVPMSTDAGDDFQNQAQFASETDTAEVHDGGTYTNGTKQGLSDKLSNKQSVTIAGHRRWDYFIRRAKDGEEFACGNKIYWCVCKQCDDAFINGISNKRPKFIRGRNEQMDNHLVECEFTSNDVLTWKRKDTISKSKRSKVNKAVDLADEKPEAESTSSLTSSLDSSIPNGTESPPISLAGRIEHLSFFMNRVQCLQSERNGRKFSVGVLLPGVYTFTAECPERVSVLGGLMLVSFSVDHPTWIPFPAGTNYEVKLNQKFVVKIDDTTTFQGEYFSPDPPIATVATQSVMQGTSSVQMPFQHPTNRVMQVHNPCLGVSRITQYSSTILQRDTPSTDRQNNQT